MQRLLWTVDKHLSDCLNLEYYNLNFYYHYNLKYHIEIIFILKDYINIKNVNFKEVNTATKNQRMVAQISSFHVYLWN